ncbi:MAG: putative lipid II flippase FtsW [Ferrimonas sp.]
MLIRESIKQRVYALGQWRPHWADGSLAADEPLFDRLLLVLIVTLLAFGLVMVTSASIPEATHLNYDPLYFVYRQAFFVAFALVLIVIGCCIPIRWWIAHSSYIALIAVLLLLLVLMVGKSVNGAQRWLALGSFNLQVAEPAKFALFLFMAGFITRRHPQLQKGYSGIFKTCLVFVVFASLLLFQPDYGSVAVMFCTIVGMIFLAGLNLAYLLFFLVIGVALLILLALTAPYRIARLTSFWDPWQDPFGSGYQLTHSLMAYGRGNWFGEGLGNSIQKLNFLPEAHTDFIAAIVGEELGFIGLLGLLLLQLFLALRALWIGHLAIRLEQSAAGFWAYGIGIWFSAQTAVNIGASVGALPTKGLTLPLFSYGGSSLWVMSVAAAVLLRIDYERREAQRQITTSPQASRETP